MHIANRSWLVRACGWEENIVTSKQIIEGYISIEYCRSLFIRLTADSASLCMNQCKNDGHVVTCETPVPAAYAEVLLKRSGQAVINKTRHHINWQGYCFVIDQFTGFLFGLRRAQVEVGAKDQSFAPPWWFGREITSEQWYLDHRLVQDGLPEY